MTIGSVLIPRFSLLAAMGGRREMLREPTALAPQPGREQAVEERRRLELRKRASNRSRAREIVKTEKRGRVRFGVLFVALTVTVVVVVVVMFETLAWLVGG